MLPIIGELGLTVAVIFLYQLSSEPGLQSDSRYDCVFAT